MNCLIADMGENNAFLWRRINLHDYFTLHTKINSQGMETLM